MKKRFWLFVALCLSAVLSLGVFAACDNGEEDPTPSGDGEAAALTDGIFTASADASHQMVFRFKEDGTFYANDMMMQTAYQGKYELVDLDVTYIDAGADDTVNWVVDDGGNKIVDSDGNWSIQESPDPIANKDTADLKATQAVRFFETDGTTPFVVNDAGTDHQFYGEDTPTNVAAYTVVDGEGRLHNISLGGFTRTLRQDPDSDFTDEDEIRNLLYELMPEELPQWAVEANEETPDNPYTIQDLTFRVYHNGYDDLATGETLVSGTYTTAAGNDANTTVYTLSEGGTLTLTVDGDDYSAVYTNGDETIDFVKWEEAAALLGTLEGTIAGRVTVTLELYEDGSAVFVNGTERTNAEWAQTESGIQLTLNGFTQTDSVYDSETGKLTVAGNYSYSGMSLPVSLEGSVSFGAEVMKQLTVDVPVGTGINVPFTLTFTDDGKVVLFGSLGADRSVEVTADWVLDTSSAVPDLVFSNISNGTLVCRLGGTQESPTATIAWEGKLDPQMPTDTTIEFVMPAGELSDLQGAAPVLNILYTFKGTDSKINQEIVLELYDNHTLSLIAAKGTEKETEIDTGTWSSESVNFTLDFGVNENDITVDLSKGTPIHWTGPIYGGMVTVSVDLSIVR